MRRVTFLAALFSSLSFGQSVSFGVKSGVPLTDAFSSETSMGVDTRTHAFSASRNYVVGPAFELGLPLGFSVEADALYRPLNLAVDYSTIPLGTVHTSSNIASWEFPILAKYRFLHTVALLSPYIEAGPVFRAVGSAASSLSNRGVTLGGGVDIKIWRLRVMPELRYSHWGQDAAGTPYIVAYPSNQNQAEFLIGIGF